MNNAEHKYVDVTLAKFPVASVYADCDFVQFKQLIDESGNLFLVYDSMSKEALDASVVAVCFTADKTSGYFLQVAALYLYDGYYDQGKTRYSCLVHAEIMRQYLGELFKGWHRVVREKNYYYASPLFSFLSFFVVYRETVYKRLWSKNCFSFIAGGKLPLNECGRIF